MSSKKPRLTVSKTSSGVWQLAGEMTMDGVSDARKEVMRDRPSSGQWQVECKALAALDSAGLALILDMVRYAHTHKVALTVRGLSPVVKELAEVQGVAELLTGVQYDA